MANPKANNTTDKPKRYPTVFTPTKIFFFFVFTSISIFIASQDDGSHFFLDDGPSLTPTWYIRLWFADIAQKIANAAKPSSLKMLSSIQQVSDSSVLKVFSELDVAGVFSNLEHGKEWFTCEDIATGLQTTVNLENFCRLLDYSSHLGLLEKHYISSLYSLNKRETVYSLSYFGAYLSSQHPNSLRAYIEFIHSAEVSSLFSNLKQSVLGESDNTEILQEFEQSGKLLKAQKSFNQIYIQSIFDGINDSVHYGQCNNFCELFPSSHSTPFVQLLTENKFVDKITTIKSSETHFFTESNQCDCYVSFRPFISQSAEQINKSFKQLSSHPSLESSRIYLVDFIDDSTTISLLDQFYRSFDLVAMLSGQHKIYTIDQIKDLLQQTNLKYESHAITKSPFSIVRVSKN